MFCHPIEVRFRDVDAMRHVNNAVYFTYLEQARVAYWLALRGSYRVEDINFILARAECDYRHPITLGDAVDVRLWVSSFGRASFTVDYEIVDRDSGRVFATAKTVLVMYDYARNAVVPIPDGLRTRMEELLEESGIGNQESGGRPRRQVP
jgi:acyl-CoA thioester hydrolase